MDFKRMIGMLRNVADKTSFRRRFFHVLDKNSLISDRATPFKYMVTPFWAYGYTLLLNGVALFNPVISLLCSFLPIGTSVTARGNSGFP